MTEDEGAPYEKRRERKGIKGEESEREEWRVLSLLLVELLCHKSECVCKYRQTCEMYHDHYPGLGIPIAVFHGVKNNLSINKITRT